MTRPASLLLTGIHILGRPDLTELLVRDGVVAALGEGLAGVAPAGTERVELGGRTVLPGLWDAHVHFGQLVIAGTRLDVSAAGSAREAARLVATRLAADPGDAPVHGYGFRDGLWPDRPVAALLDEVAGDRPVVLASGDLHCGWLSSAAARLHGVATDEGVMREDDWYALARSIDESSREGVEAEAAEVTARAAARGLVGIVDFEEDDNPALWTRRVARGVDALHVVASFWPPQLDEVLAAGRRSGDPLPGTDGLVTLGHLKVIIDGSLNTRTAYCDDPYEDGSSGVLTVGEITLERLLSRAREGGIVPAVHAIGDRAVSVALDAFERVGIPGVVEHAQLVADRDLPRFARLGVAASVQPEHALDDRDVADRHWRGRTGRAFPYASLLQAGAELRLGSDAPVAPLDPWVTIAAAAYRDRDGREPWHPEQRITVRQAIAASTRAAGVAPRVTAPADLTITDADPLTADPGTLRAMPVAGTLRGGRWTHRAF